MIQVELKNRLWACTDRISLAELVSGELAALFEGRRARLFLFNDPRGAARLPLGSASFNDQGGATRLPLGPPSFDELKTAMGLNDPVSQFLQRWECPVHEAQLVDNQTWRRYCPRADHGHVLVGPILVAGALMGVVAVTRDQHDPAFANADLQRMTQLSLHLSSRLSDMERITPALPQLTPRENEVAHKVAQGLSNAAIGKELDVTEQTVKQFLKSIFRKWHLRSRAQLVARVAGLRNAANSG